MIMQDFTTFAGRFIFPLIVLLIVVDAHSLRTTGSDDVVKIHIILYAHGIASLLALLTSLLIIYSPDSIMVPLVIFVSIIVITKAQNTQGYIENMEGASGVLLYLSSVLTPAVIILVAFLMILYYYRFYFPDDDRSHLIILEVLNIADALLLTIISVIIPTTSIIGSLWTIICCFTVFSIILPSINSKIADLLLTHMPTSIITILQKEWL